MSVHKNISTQKSSYSPPDPTGTEYRPDENLTYLLCPYKAHLWTDIYLLRQVGFSRFKTVELECTTVLSLCRDGPSRQTLIPTMTDLPTRSLVLTDDVTETVRPRVRFLRDR